jgi:OOP family OmpA-OmpF porin
MRFVRLAVLSLLSLWHLSAAAPLAHAQGDFGDEFDDEFGPPRPAPAPAPAPAPTPRAAPAPAPTPAPARVTDDEFDDEFSGAPADPQPAPAPVAEEEATPTEVTVESDEAPAPRSAREQAAADSELRLRLFRAHNTFLGPTGGIHVVGADSGPRGSFRVALMAEFFRSNGFLTPSDGAQRFGGALSLSWTAHQNIEVFASLLSYATTNEGSDPDLIQVLGDTHLGIKGFHWVTPFLAIGGDVDLNLLNHVGDIGVVLRSTSLGIRANLTADLRGLESSIPFIVRFNARYWMDNSSELIEATERQRYAGLADPLPVEDERRHLLTAAERFALEVNRTDFIDLSLGLEAPLRVMEDFYIHPMVEWNWRLPVNRQGYDCVFVPDPDRPSRPEAGDDGCLDVQGISSFPMTLSVGVRVLPPVRGLAITVAADIGLTGVNTLVRELAPTQPYNILIGASYAYDTTPPAPEIREVEVEREVQVAPPPRGRIAGVAVEQGSGAPIPGAIVRFPGRAETALLAGPDGTFVTYPFDPGAVELAIEHDEYRPNTCSATIPEPAAGATEDMRVEVRCELEALPRRGDVDGRVIDEDGPVSGAVLELNGPSSHRVVSDGSGAFRLEGVAPGVYTARIESEGHLIKLAEFSVAPRETARPEITLLRRPRRSLVSVTARAIVIRRQINFATDSDEILEQSFGLMEEIADVIMRNPQLTSIEIQGHTDDRGGREHNQDLSQRRADSVRAWLVQHGVEASRLQAMGYGQTRPLVPNITSANRARNRRVQFVVQ